MDFRFVAYDPQTGERLYQLPRSNSVKIGDTFGTRGTLELTYSAKAVNARDLPTFLEVQAEVTFDEGDNWAPVGPSLLRLSGSHEDTDQAGMRTLQFVGREWLLGKARVGNGDLELIDGKRPFYQASPGQILRTLILEAQDRGAADGIEIGNFTASKDSSGNSWSKVATIYYGPGLPISSVLENLVEQGMCDYRMNGRTIELFDPETTMGRDLTTGNNPVRVHGAVTEAPVKYTLEDLANSALLMGDEGFELEVDNPTAPDDYGRLEVTIEQGGVSDSGTARLMVDEALHRGSREVREITRSQSAAGAAFLPFRDYRVGDYVQVHTGGAWERYRVREIQLARDGQEWTIHTVINDRLQELLLKLAKRTSGIVNGSTGSGGDGTQPTPPAKPGIEPAAPEGLVIDQQVYLDRQGIARGQITAGWGSVTESTKGTAVEIGGYELWWRRNDTQETWTRVAVTDGANAVSHSPVVLTDTFGNAMEYQWRVRAIAEASTRPGPFSDIVTMTMTQDTEPPNAPSLPTVSTDLRIITVDVDGLDEFGEAMPVDFNHTRIYFAAAEDMVGAERVGSLTQPGMWNSGSMDPDVPVWVAVSAVDHVGNESAMTAAQSVTPQKLVDDDSIRDELGTIDDKINNAVDDLNQAIDNIVIDTNGTTTYQTPYEPDETTDPAPKAGDLWFDTSVEGNNKLHRFDGQGWVSAADQRIDTIGQAQDDLEADVDRVRTSVDGKNAVTQSTSTPPNQYDGAVGDIWEIMSSMGSGGRSVSRWRWNGTVWVSNLIGDTVLGNVDAAKIGTGYLDAGRIEAGSIAADKLIIGAGSEFIPDPNFSNGDRGWLLRDADSSIVVGGGENGSNAWVVQGTGVTASAYSLPWEVAGAQKFRVRTRLKAENEVTTNGQVRVYLRSHQADGSYVNKEFSLPKFSADEWVNVDEIMETTGQALKADLRLVAHGSFGTNNTLYVTLASAMQAVGATLIEDGAITTDKIEAGAITTDSAIFGTMDAGILNAGEIDADRIGAQTITADKLLVGGAGNLIPWSNTRVSPHEATNGLDLITTTDPTIGETLSVTGGGEGWGEAVRIYYDSDFRIPVRPGVKVKTSATVGSVGATPPGGMRISYFWYDGAGSYVSLDRSATMTDIPRASSGGGPLEFETTVPDGMYFLRVSIDIEGPLDGSWVRVQDVSVREMVGATLIEDGAITTDKILANAITAGKIAALAIEADHISANAITADKIHAGAIDSMLITGARIRTAASGRRTELDVEGLKSYDTSGNTVLTTQTSDGSIEMRGILSQTARGQTIRVGGEYQSSGPGIQWSDSNVWNYPPGVAYGTSPDDPNSKRTLVQGPGVNEGNSFLTLYEQGDQFDLRTWKGTGSSRNDWAVKAHMDDNFMRIGSSDSASPYLYMERSSSGGYARLSSGDDSWVNATENDVYVQANSSGSGGVFIRRGPGGASGDDGFMSLTGDGIYLNPQGSRKIHLVSDTIRINGDLPVAGSWANLVRSSGNLAYVPSSRRYKMLEESIETTVDSFEDKLLSVQAKTWFYKQPAERYAEYLSSVANGEEPERSPESLGEIVRTPGLIAEDLHDAGLGVFVTYDDEDRPDSVMHEGIAPALIPIIRRLRDRVDALETKLGETA